MGGTGSAGPVMFLTPCLGESYLRVQQGAWLGGADACAGGLQEHCASLNRLPATPEPGPRTCHSSGFLGVRRECAGPERTRSLCQGHNSCLLTMGVFREVLQGVLSGEYIPVRI